MAKLAIFITLVWFALGAQGSTHDATMTPEAKGADVVERVADRILGACVFDDDKLFLRRVSFVETADGENSDTFRPGYNGGIWKVDQDMFQKTKEAATLVTLSSYLSEIKKVFGIDWSTTSWNDCRKPLVSALAARLYIQRQLEGTRRTFPRDIPSQAEFWSTLYHNGGDKKKFEDAANSLFKRCKQIYGADLAFIMDGSGSVTRGNFNKMKEFIKDVLGTFDIGSNATRVAVGTYSANYNTNFYLNTYFTRSAMIKKISSISYPSGGTRTDYALDKLVSEIFTARRGARTHSSGVPRVAVILTDGQSNYPAKTVVSALKAHEADITMFAVAVGSKVYEPELEAIASEPECLHLLKLDNFNEVDSLKYAISTRTCDAPVIAGPGKDGTEIEGKLPPGGDQNCKLKVPDGGTTIKIKADKGKATFYVASNTYPSDSYYDVKIEAVPKYPGVVFVPKPATQDSEGIVFCNIKGDKTKDTDVDIGIIPGDEDRCKTKPCQNGGKCVDEGADYRCECATGYEGKNCDKPVDNCKPNPCKNSATCLSGVGTYTCQCTAGFQGKNCDQPVDNCKPNPCQNSGTCVSSGGTYTCQCTAGFQGKNCDKPVVTDPCKPNPCIKGSCSSQNGNFLCTCQTGWKGTHCNEAKDRCTHNPCTHGNCTSLGTRYECCCEHGWTGANCDQEIDECKSSPCVHGECKNRENGYTCICKEGYIGQHCEIPVDECHSSPCVHGDCEDKVNGFLCHCQHGWDGIRCDIDIDECISNPCQHGQCNDKINYYLCFCDAGWIGPNCDINVDECESSPCHQGTCIDQVNGYICKCAPGWTGTNCDKNIDECISNPCVHGECMDGINRFDCTCHPGYTGTLCDKDIDECESSPCLNGAFCDNRINEYLCECKSGFTGKHCETDIDECKSNPCKHGTCRDHVDKYSCVCLSGWTGYNCDCLIDNCESNPCRNGICRNAINSYTCVCNYGYTGINCDKEEAVSSTRRPFTTPVTKAPTGGRYSCRGNNPCTPYNLNHGMFYHAHLKSNMFVQCDEHGGCFEMPCPTGLVWDVKAYTCNRP